MEIDITRVYVKADNYNASKMPKYQNGILCGQRLKTLRQTENDTYKELVFYGCINNSKFYPIWNFEIVIDFKVETDNSLEITDDEVENFMQDAYKRAKSCFSNYCSGKPPLDTYTLAIVSNFGIPAALF